MATVRRLEQAFCGVAILLVALIHYQNVNYDLPSLHTMRERDVAWILPPTTTTTFQTNLSSSTTATTTQQQQHMAACLMVRDDNTLMYEWLAYHYITMPLRHVLIAADVGSTQDPATVAQHWDGTPLNITIWNYTHFIHRFGDIPVKKEEDENHHYVHRQLAFITSCAEYMKAAGEQWVAFVDTDEYLVINRITQQEEDSQQQHNNNKLVEKKGKLKGQLQGLVLEPNSTLSLATEQRRQASMAFTIMDAIGRVTHPLHPCHVVPRLLVSALENVTCPMHEETKRQHQQGLFRTTTTTIDSRPLHLTTLRFVQHAKKGSFYPSKWGKVLVDVSRLSSEESFTKKPKSSHRPFPACPKPLVGFDTALFHLNHYLGDWDRYSSRNDSRRSRKAFEERAYFSHGTTCGMKMHEWVTPLVDTFGIDKARVLLGL